MNLDEMLKNLDQPITDNGFSQQVLTKIALNQKPAAFPWAETSWAIAVSLVITLFLWRGLAWKGALACALTVTHSFSTGHGLLVFAILFVAWLSNDEPSVATQAR